MKLKVIEVNRYVFDGKVEMEVSNVEMNDELWGDDEGMWYEFNKRYDDVGSKEGVLEGWKVVREENVMMVSSEGEDVMFVRV